ILTNLKKNSSLFINQFMPNFYNNTTTFLIGMLLGNVSAGLFGAIRQITNILSVFNAVISMVFFSYLVRKKEKFYLFSKFYLVGFFVLTISLILIHPLIFKWLGVVDNNLSLIFNMLSFGVFFIAVYSLYSTNYLIPRGYDRVVLKNTLFISMLGLISSYPLIKVFGLIGGAINIAFAQFLMGISSYFYYRKVIKKL